MQRFVGNVHLLLISPVTSKRDSCDGASMSMLSEPRINWRPQGHYEAARPGLVPERLQLQCACPGMPQGVVVVTNVNIWGAVLVGEGKFLAILVSKDRLVLGIIQEVGALVGSRGVFLGLGWRHCDNTRWGW